MKITIDQLRDTFLAECNRVSNLTVGRDYFQAYEIAAFLNIAYTSCLNKRMTVIDERFLPVQQRSQSQGISLASDMRMLQEFGELYGGANPVAEKEFSGAHQDKIAMENTHLFPIKKINNSIPYIMGLQIYEYNDTSAQTNAIPIAAYICKPMTVSDAPRLTMVYRSSKYMPYLYYRIRTGFAAQDIDRYIEINLTPQSTSSKFYVTYDYISVPKPIIPEQIAKGSSNYVEVLFGLEVATEASILAMRSLGEK